MKTFPGLIVLLAFSSLPALAQDVDLDDITMTVVRDGMFEANHLNRPDAAAIREFLENNEGALPGHFSKSTPGIQAGFEGMRETMTPEDASAVDAVREGMGDSRRDRNFPERGELPEGLDQAQMEEIRAALSADNREAQENLRQQMHRPSGEKIERPDPMET